jgi:ABC-2 type transport system permease protein
MNPTNKFFLAVVLFPIRFYSRLGVNAAHLRSILTTKLIMDDRRPNTFQQANKKKDKPVSSATIGTMMLSALLGCFFLTGFAVGKDYVTHLTIYFSMYIFMLASTLISDFTSVLIDVRDNYIILPKPVNDRTVVVARLLHITIHLSKLVVPMTLPGLIFMCIKLNAWSTLILFVMVLFVTIFTIFLINALYIIILKVTTPQKFQTIISYFQIFFAVFIYGGYQLVPRLIDKVSIHGYDISSNNWIWLAPSYWFAGAWQLLAAFEVQPAWLIAFVLSVAVPVLSILVVVKYFAPSFNQKLSMIAGSSAEAAPKADAKKIVSTTSAYVTTLAKTFAAKGAERMAFLNCWKMTARSKEFKMKVYPSFGYLFVYIIIMLMNSKTLSLEDFRQQTTEGKILLVSVIYFSSFMLVTAISQIAYSDKFKAAWIYFVAPIQSPGELITGALKSAMLKFYVPIIIVVAIPAIWLGGVKVVPNLALGLFNELLICSLIAYISVRHLPFSVNQSTASKSGTFIRNLFMLLIPAIIGFAHYFIYDYTWVVSIVAVLSIIATWLVIGAVKNTTWLQVKTTYED